MATGAETLSGEIEQKLRSALVRILKINVGKDLKKITATIRKDVNELEIVLKVKLHDLDIDLHKLVHNENLRSDKIVGGIRELGYKVPKIFKEDVGKLEDLATMGVRENEREILAILHSIEKKLGEGGGKK